MPCALRAPHVSRCIHTARRFSVTLVSVPSSRRRPAQILCQCGLLMLRLLRPNSAAPLRASNAPIRDIPYLTASKPRRNLRIGVIYLRLWNLTLSGGIVLSSNVSLAVMHPYLCVHFRVRRTEATNSAIYDVSSKVYRDLFALDVAHHDMTLCLKQRRIPTPRTNLRHRTPRFSNRDSIAVSTVSRFPVFDPVSRWRLCVL